MNFYLLRVFSPQYTLSSFCFLCRPCDAVRRRTLSSVVLLDSTFLFNGSMNFREVIRTS